MLDSALRESSVESREQKNPFRALPDPYFLTSMICDIVAKTMC